MNHLTNADTGNGENNDNNKNLLYVAHCSTCPSGHSRRSRQPQMGHWSANRTVYVEQVFRWRRRRWRRRGWQATAAGNVIVKKGIKKSKNTNKNNK